MKIPNAKNTAFILGTLLLAIALMINAAMHGADFEVFYVAGKRVLSGEPIYQFTDGWFPFKYHPAWAAFFAPWTLLPMRVSVVLFTILNLGLWSFAARDWFRLLQKKITPGAVFLLFLLSLNALSAETSFGQINGFLFWGCTQIFLWMENPQPKAFRSGFLLAVIVSLKLNFAIMLAYVVVRNWRSIFGIIAGTVALHLLVVLIIPGAADFSLYRQWYALLLTQSGGQFDMFEVQGVLRFCIELFGSTLAKPIWFLLLLVGVGFGIYWNRFSKAASRLPVNEKTTLTGAYWFSLIFFFSPLAWWYQILYLYPMAFLLLQKSEGKHRRRWIYASLFCFSIIGYNTLGHDGIIFFKNYMGYFASAVVLFVLLVEIKLKRMRPDRT